MGTQFLNVDVGRCMINLTNKPKSTMFRFVALFALVAVALAEPEADAQVFVHPYNTVGVNGVPLVNTYTNVVNPVVPVVKPVVPVVKPVVPVVKYTMPIAKAPVVKYINPHHTEGMTKEGVPEETASVKIAEKQHEIAQVVEDSKVKEVQGYVAPYTTSPQLPELSPHTSTTHMVILFTSVKLILNLMPPTFTPTHMLVLPTPTHT